VLLAAERAALARGTCAEHGEEDVLRYRRWTDGAMVCAQAIRELARHTHYIQACDKCGADGAWRNPYTRRDEYLCGTCHAKSGDGIVQNKWAPRVSQPHPLGQRPVCEAKGVVGTRECRGEVRWRRNKAGDYHDLCNAHAGKVSAADGLADRVWD
jgi:hypothetical protein